MTLSRNAVVTLSREPANPSRWAEISQVGGRAGSIRSIGWSIAFRAKAMPKASKSRSAVIIIEGESGKHNNMMQPVQRITDRGADPVNGRVVADFSKIAWNGGMISVALVGGALTVTPLLFCIFVLLTWTTLLTGHSIGMHRMMIHRSFSATPWIEKALVYIGVVVGMGGPATIIATHDLRDWAQRQSVAHDFFTHRQTYWKDLAWQLFCRFEFEKAPLLTIESKFSSDPFYIFLDRSWRWHQLAIALPTYLLGGFPAVVWCVCTRVSLSVIGHWTITYFCHNPGPGKWQVPEAGVQASNLPGFGFLTFGECWHNNHHAFPESARVGLDRGQTDPAAWLIEQFEKMGLVDNVGQPRSNCEQDDLLVADHGTRTVSTASAASPG